MSRTIATVKRPEPHHFRADAIDPKTCADCPLPEVNSVHSAEEIARHRAEQAAAAGRVAEAQAAHRRRTGES